jgi:hypothetical protein
VWAWLMILHGFGLLRSGWVSLIIDGQHWKHATETPAERDMLSEVPAPAFLEDFCGKLNQYSAGDGDVVVILEGAQEGCRLRN